METDSDRSRVTLDPAMRTLGAALLLRPSAELLLAGLPALPAAEGGDLHLCGMDARWLSQQRRANVESVCCAERVVKERGCAEGRCSEMSCKTQAQVELWEYVQHAV